MQYSLSWYQIPYRCQHVTVSIRGQFSVFNVGLPSVLHISTELVWYCVPILPALVRYGKPWYYVNRLAVCFPPSHVFFPPSLSLLTSISRLDIDISSLGTKPSACTLVVQVGMVWYTKVLNHVRWGCTNLKKNHVGWERSNFSI